MSDSNRTWFPMIFSEKCDGCVQFGRPRCVEYCQNSVFTFHDGKAVVAHPHKCVNGCAACEPICQKKAISFPKRLTSYIPVISEDKIRLTLLNYLLNSMLREIFHHFRGYSINYIRYLPVCNRIESSSSILSILNQSTVF